ncbi:ornithine cyclodeaminase, partial [Rhizobiaceae bacterium]|nr:ornithine cyclodeaminase [Rhizobiaceae bacterium]
MPALPHLDAETIAAVATWPLVIEALREGHRGPRAQLADSFVHRGEDTLLTRSAWIEGLAAGTKTATIISSNGARGLPNVQALMTLFDPETGEPRATVDATPLTAWKTAADSALGCDLLAQAEPTTLLMIGAGAMAAPLIAAHRTVRPTLKRVLI